MQHTSLRWWKMRGRAQIPVYDSRTRVIIANSVLRASFDRYTFSPYPWISILVYIYIYSSKTDFSVSFARFLFFFPMILVKMKNFEREGKKNWSIDEWTFWKFWKNLLLIRIYLCFYEYLRGNVKTSSSSSFSSSKIHRVCIKSARGSKKTCFRDKQSNDPC